MPQPRSSFVQRVIRWRFLFIVNMLVIVFFGLTIGREYMRTYSIQKEIEQLQAQAESLTARNSSLSELQTAVQTASYIEREARLKLGLKKEGEQVVVIQQQDVSNPDAVTETTVDSTDPLQYVLSQNEEQPSVANATKWWYYFFHKSAYNELRRVQEN